MLDSLADGNCRFLCEASFLLKFNYYVQCKKRIGNQNVDVLSRVPISRSTNSQLINLLMKEVKTEM